MPLLEPSSAVEQLLGNNSSKSNRNVNNYTCNYDKNNVYHLLIVVLLVLVIVFLFTNNNGKKNNDLTIETLAKQQQNWLKQVWI